MCTSRAPVVISRLLSQDTVEHNARLGAGFTLVELLVTVSLVAFFTSLAVGYNRSADQQIILFREQARAVNTVYQVRSLAIAIYSSPRGATVPCGYGIFIPPDQQPGKGQLIVFKEMPSVRNNDCSQFSGIGSFYDDPANELIETVTLDRVSILSDFSEMLLVPPIPAVYGTGINDGAFPVSLRLTTAAGYNTTITVNAFGQISVLSQ